MKTKTKQKKKEGKKTQINDREDIFVKFEIECVDLKGHLRRFNKKKFDLVLYLPQTTCWFTWQEGNSVRTL